MGGRLAGQKAVITGAGAGLGREAALRFAAEGAAIAVLDLDQAAAEETVRQLEAAGGSGIALTVDVADASSVQIAIDSAAAGLGAIDILFNNAGPFLRGGNAADEQDDWNRCMAVTVRGVFLCSRAALRHMDPRPGTSAVIINTAPVAGPTEGNAAAYCAAKGAVISLTRAMANDLAPRRIRVNAICPGTAQAPMIESATPLVAGARHGGGAALPQQQYPVGRLGSATDVANLALFLASDESSSMTGSIVTADGGMRSR